MLIERQDGSASLPARGLSPSRDFVDVRGAALAGDRNGLALGVAGQVRGGPASRVAIRVFRRGRTSGWTRLPALREPLDSGGSLSVVQLQGAPCVGYDTPVGRPVLSCASHRRWRLLPREGLPARPVRLTTLTVFDGRPLVLFRARRSVVTLQLNRGRWRRLGQPIPTGGAIAVVGEGYAGLDTLDLALEDVARGRRVIWTLAHGRWLRQPALTGVGAGPMPAGPVRVGGRLYLPVNDASVDPWQFSVYRLEHGRWSRAGTALNSGPGNAQGSVSVDGRSVWAAWQQHDPRPDGLFDTRIYVQALTPAGRPADTVWQGISLGPGDVQTVEALGGHWVVYMPQAAGRNALTVRVEPLG